MKDPLWTEGDSLTDGWASGTAPSNTWTAGAALTDGWVATSTPVTGVYIPILVTGDDGIFIIGDDGEYIEAD